MPEEFAFAIRRFDAPGVRPHLLAADGLAAQEAWVKALSRASFGYMRLVVRELESQLREARHSLDLHRRSSRKAVSSRCKPQALTAGLLALRTATPSPETAAQWAWWKKWAAGQQGGAWPSGSCRALPASPRQGAEPVSPETSCFLPCMSGNGREIYGAEAGLAAEGPGEPARMQGPGQTLSLGPFRFSPCPAGQDARASAFSGV